MGTDGLLPGIPKGESWRGLSAAETQSGIYVQSRSWQGTFRIPAALYYRRENGDFVYAYKEATGTAVSGTTYYERTGAGTSSDPYVYVEKVVEEGVSVEGLYVRGGRYTTINPSEEELNYPVLDEEGNQQTEDVNVMDTSTQNAVISIMREYTTISDTEILDMFVTEE